MAKEFTPGPWTVEGDTATGFSIYADDTPVVWEMGGIDNEANARLTAAAPDLYEACQAALEYLNEYTPDAYPPGLNVAAQTLHAAIKQARGGG